MTTNEFIDKIAREGGVVKALSYGLKADDLEDQNSDLAEAWRDIEREWQAFQAGPLGAVQDLLQDLLPGDG
jgi:hypothetical protein